MERQIMTKFASTILGLTLMTLLPVDAVRADETTADAPQQTAFLNLFAPFRPNYYRPTAYAPTARYGNTGTHCTNGRCYTTPSYVPTTSSCVNGQCGTYQSNYCPNGQCGTGIGYRPAPVFQPTVTPYRRYNPNYVAPSNQYGPIQFNTKPAGSTSPYFGGY